MLLLFMSDAFVQFSPSEAHVQRYSNQAIHHATKLTSAEGLGLLVNDKGVHFFPTNSMRLAGVMLLPLDETSN